MGQLQSRGRMQIAIITRQYLHAVHTARFNNNLTVETKLSYYAFIIYWFLVTEQLRSNI